MVLVHEGAVVAGEDGEGAVGEAEPDGVVVGGGFARRRRADVFGAFEAGFVEIRAREEEVLWAGFGVDGEAAGLGGAEVGGDAGGGDVDDEAGWGG